MATTTTTSRRRQGEGLELKQERKGNKNYIIRRKELQFYNTHFFMNRIHIFTSIAVVILAQREIQRATNYYYGTRKMYVPQAHI